MWRMIHTEFRFSYTTSQISSYVKDDPYWIQIQLHNKHISSYVKDDPYWIQIQLHNIADL